jgi:hypothetical protein
MILVTPELDVPMPTSLTPEEAKSLHARARAAFNTVEFLEGMGLPPVPPTPRDRKEARALFFETPGADPEVNTSGKALMLRALLDEYDIEVVRNAAQVRSYIKLRLLELSEVGKEPTQLKALELLGRMSDVHAFAEHIEVNVTHRTTEELQQTLAQKLSAYLHDVVDVEAKVLGHVNSPDVQEQALLNGAPAVQVIDLDEELGRTGGELGLMNEADRLEAAEFGGYDETDDVNEVYPR